jgi:hypothetical protein
MSIFDRLKVQSHPVEDAESIKAWMSRYGGEHAPGQFTREVDGEPHTGNGYFIHRPFDEVHNPGRIIFQMDDVSEDGRVEAFMVADGDALLVDPAQLVIRSRMRPPSELL